MAADRRSPGSAGFGAAATKRRAAGRLAPLPPAPGTPDRRKYTVRIEAEAADRFERAVINAIGTIGRKVDKSEVMRELAELFATDAQVAKKVTDALRRH